MGSITQSKRIVFKGPRQTKTKPTKKSLATKKFKNAASTMSLRQLWELGSRKKK